MVERRLSQAESGQLLGLCRDLLGAGSPREPQRDRDSAAGATARPAEGQSSTNQGFFCQFGGWFYYCDTHEPELLLLFKSFKFALLP